MNEIAELPPCTYLYFNGMPFEDQNNVTVTTFDTFSFSIELTPSFGILYNRLFLISNNLLNSNLLLEDQNNFSIAIEILNEAIENYPFEQFGWKRSDKAPVLGMGAAFANHPLPPYQMLREYS